MLKKKKKVLNNKELLAPVLDNQYSCSCLLQSIIAILRLLFFSQREIENSWVQDCSSKQETPLFNIRS